MAKMHASLSRRGFFARAFAILPASAMTSVALISTAVAAPPCKAATRIFSGEGMITELEGLGFRFELGPDNTIERGFIEWFPELRSGTADDIYREWWRLY